MHIEEKPMFRYVVNSTTAVIETPKYALLNPAQYVEEIAASLNQTENIKDYRFAVFEEVPCVILNFNVDIDKFAATQTHLEKEILPTLPQINKDVSKGIKSEQAIPAKTVPVFEGDRFVAQKEDPTNLGEQLFVVTPLSEKNKEEKDKTKFTIVKRETEKGVSDTFILEDSNGNPIKIKGVAALEKKFKLPSNFDPELVPTDMSELEERGLARTSLADVLTDEQLAEVKKEYKDILDSTFGPKKKERLKTELIRKIEKYEKDNNAKLDEAYKATLPQRPEDKELTEYKEDYPLYTITLENPENPGSAETFTILSKSKDQYGEVTFTLKNNVTGETGNAFLSDVERFFTLPQDFDMNAVPEAAVSQNSESEQSEVTYGEDYPEKELDETSEKVMGQPSKVYPEEYAAAIPKMREFLTLKENPEFQEKMFKNYYKINKAYGKRFKEFEIWIDQVIAEHEKKNNMTVSDQARQKTTEKYLLSKKLDPALYDLWKKLLARIDRTTYLQWLPLKNIDTRFIKEYEQYRQKPEDVFANSLVFTYEGLLKFGFGRKLADDLSALPPDEPTTIVDQATNDMVDVTKKVTPDNKEIFVIDDATKGEKKAVGEGDPAIATLESTGLAVTTAFTSDQFIKIAQLLETTL